MGLRGRLAGGLPTAAVPVKAGDGTAEHVTVTALPALRFDELLAEHPPTDAQRFDGLTFDPETFVPALLAACVDGGWSAQDWVEQMRAGTSEVVELFTTVYELNRRIPDVR